MRLDPKAIEIITSRTKSVIGEDIAIWLFGSRVDDQLKGGDIDLLIEVNHKFENRVAVACQINAKIQIALGAQRLDIIVKDVDTESLPIHEIAKKNGIRLC
jgi:hypothetical protein